MFWLSARLTDLSLIFTNSWCDHQLLPSGWTWEYEGALTNNSGSITDTYSYTAFGDLFNSTGTTVNPYQYTGQQFDSLTGLYSLRARYYNPALGRFLSQDTYPVNFSNPVEFNRYAYTANNPINAIDPSGNQALFEFAVSLANDRVVQGALLGAGLGAASALLCGGNWIQGAVVGAALGATFSAGMLVDPALTSVIGIVGGSFGLSASYLDYQENGLTACNFINGLASVVAIGGSFASGFGGGGPSTQLAFAWNTGGSTSVAVPGVGAGSQALTGLGAISLVNMMSGRGGGQEHHILSNKILRALNKHPKLRGMFNRDDFIVRAASEPDHRGYQTWHRLYDMEVTNWLEKHPAATRADFFNFLREIYSREGLRKAFPGALDILR